MGTASLFLSMVLVFASPAVSQTPDDYLIVPGVRIGESTLEMSMFDLRLMNGRGNERRVYAGAEPHLDARRDFWIYGWSSRALAAVTFDGKKAEELFAGYNQGGVPFATDRGIMLLQSTRSDILKVYGKPTVVLKATSNGRVDLIYDKVGVAFRVWIQAGRLCTYISSGPGAPRVSGSSRRDAAVRL